MRIRVGILVSIGALSSALCLQADNPCPQGGATCIEISSAVNAVTGTTVTVDSVDGGLSPYTGTMYQTNGSVTTSASLTLYCDDLNSEFPLGSTQDVNQTWLSGNNLSNTKFVTQNPNGASGDVPGTSVPIPTGTQLYEEEAWLFTQIMNLPQGAGSTANVTAMQEAAWDLTSAALTTDEQANASAWVEAAYTNAAAGGTIGGAVDGVALHAANYSDWFVLTDVDAANNDSAGVQEFLAYSAESTNVTAAPEPATFWLLGLALLAGAAYGRKTAVRRSALASASQNQ